MSTIPPKVAQADFHVEKATETYLLGFMLPLWISVGFLDYLLHRRTKIEETSGTLESVIHLMMLTETGIPILMGLFLKINSSVIGVSIIAFLLHEVTAFCDLHYTAPRRNVMPIEQMVHSFLEVLPFSAVSFISCLHWDKFLELFPIPGNKKNKEKFALAFKSEPLPIPYTIAILLGVTVFLGIPYLEELGRCLSNKRRP